MGIEDYVHAQRSNLDSSAEDPHFAQLILLVDRLYRSAMELTPPDAPLRYGQFLMLCHKSFYASATLIGQRQPDDSAAITRRAVEIAKVCLASRTDPESMEKWLAFEQRNQRWLARRESKKPPRLPEIRFDLPINHPLFDRLQTYIGILSDYQVHFTPEYFSQQEWTIDRDSSEHPRMVLSYFCSDQRSIDSSFLNLAAIHLTVLQIIDECMDGRFSSDGGWKMLLGTFEQVGKELAAKLKPPNAGNSK